MNRWLGTPLADYAPALALLVITIVYLITGYGYEVDARGFPVVVAWVMLVLVGLDIASRTKTAIGEKLVLWLNPAAAPDKLEKHAHYPIRKQVAAALWVAGFVALMVLTGIVYGILIYVFAAMYLNGRRPLLLCLGVSAGIAYFIYRLFEYLLGVELYSGVLFPDPFADHAVAIKFAVLWYCLIVTYLFPVAVAVLSNQRPKAMAILAFLAVWGIVGLVLTADPLTAVVGLLTAVVGDFDIQFVWTVIGWTLALVWASSGTVRRDAAQINVGQKA